MGDHLYITDSHFLLPAARFDEAIAAIKARVEAEIAQTPWVENDHTTAALAADDIDAVLWAFRLVGEDDGEGNIEGVTKEDDSYPTLFVEFLKALAPFVADGGYIGGEDGGGARWRWIFRDGKVKGVDAVVSFPEE